MYSLPFDPVSAVAFEAVIGDDQRLAIPVGNGETPRFRPSDIGEMLNVSMGIDPPKRF